MTQNAGSAFDTVAREPSDVHLWPVELLVLDNARASARPFTGDDMNAEDRAWSARVDAAVQGMDVVDPAALDAWAQVHADSVVPHEQEAELVAVWETYIRDLYASDASGEQTPALVLIPAAAVDELVDDEDGWS